MEIKQIFGQRLKERRVANKKTQKELAAILNVEPNTVYKWERGLMLPSLGAVFNIAESLNISKSYLIGETDDPVPPATQKGTVGEFTTPYEHGPLQGEQGNTGLYKIITNAVPPIDISRLIRVRILDKTCNGDGTDRNPEKLEDAPAITLEIPDLAERYGYDGLCGLYADGDSMLPKIRSGDFVVFAPNEKEVLLAGKMMVVRYNGRIMIRGVIENSAGEITLKAFNPDYGDIHVTPKDDFCICGRAIRRYLIDELDSVL
jgi:transcriptional regulator with XRE-family HTH domain